MNHITRHTAVEALRVLEGKRIELIKMNDPHTTLEPGTQGTVEFVDDMGTLQMKWDNGRTIGIVHGVDQYKIIE